MSRGSMFGDDPGTAVPLPPAAAPEDKDDEDVVMVGASETRRFLAGDGARFGWCGASPVSPPCWRMAPPIDLRIAGGRCDDDEL